MDTIAGAFVSPPSGRKWLDLVLAFWDRTKAVIFLLAGLLLLVLLVYTTALFLEPTSSPKNVFVSNISDTQTTISWTTLKATRGSVHVGDKQSLSSIKKYADDLDKLTNRSGFYTTHHVTLVKLEPLHNYRYEIRQGWKTVFLGEFTTVKTLESLKNPSPVYGRVLDKDTNHSFVGALVYFKFEDGEQKSALASTLTNIEGRWTIDMANIRSQDGTSVYQMTPATKEVIIVDAGSEGRGKAESRVGKDRPWPDILVSNEN